MCSSCLYLLADAVCKNSYGLILWSTTWGLLNGKWDRDYCHNRDINGVLMVRAKTHTTRSLARKTPNVPSTVCNLQARETRTWHQTDLYCCFSHTKDATEAKEVPEAPQNYDIKIMGQTIASVRRSQVLSGMGGPTYKSQRASHITEVHMCICVHTCKTHTMTSLSRSAAPSTCGCRNQGRVQVPGVAREQVP